MSEPSLIKLGSEAAGVAAFAALGGKDLVVKLLGPTADYIGSGLKSGSEKGISNVRRIFKAGVQKLGNKIETPGAVPPRVLLGVVTEGMFVEDELQAEYMGGVLASSRTSNAKDDRGVYWLKVVTSLTTYQLRAHYVLYLSLKHYISRVNNPVKELDFAIEKQNVVFQTGKRPFIESLDLASGEDEVDIFSHISHGLKKEELIDILAWRPNPEADQGCRFKPTAEGVRLLLWGSGLGSTPLADFSKVSIPNVAGINASLDFVPVNPLSAAPRWG